MNYRINITYSKRASDLSDFLENVVSSYCHRTSVLFIILISRYFIKSVHQSVQKKCLAHTLQ